jgi:hypothetical protein
LWDSSAAGKSAKISLTAEGQGAQKTTGAGAWNANVIGAASTDDVAFRIVARGASGNVWVGLIARTAFNAEGANLYSNGGGIVVLSVYNCTVRSFFPFRFFTFDRRTAMEPTLVPKWFVLSTTGRSCAWP